MGRNSSSACLLHFLRSSLPSSACACGYRGLDLSQWKDDWQAKKQPVDFEAVERMLLDGECGLSHGVMVDCTASDAVPERYASWLARGIHVVTPNKKASSGPLGLVREGEGEG